MTPATIPVENESPVQDTDVDALNSLLRGEVAAIEVYDLVLPKFENQSAALQLQRIRDEHAESAAVLRERVRHFGADPAEGSGFWGTLGVAITSTARIFGPVTALGALKQGEEFGIGRYEATLEDPDVDTDDKDLIRYRLLPRCRQHVQEIDRLMDKVSD
jgi:demethoxyubiquinone hydroxylase (CLK1/Coq7/Cat5 family)